MTNYERIKNMSVDEMADFITDLTNGCEYGCTACAYYSGSECLVDDTYYFDNDSPHLSHCSGGCKAWLDAEVKEGVNERKEDL